MSRITDIMLLRQPETPILYIESATEITDLENLIGNNFQKPSLDLQKFNEVLTDIPFPNYGNFKEHTHLPALALNIILTPPFPEESS